jgi:hypothetical protein
MGPTALLLRAADFITFKIHRPRPGLNPRTLGPVASTLTTRSPRATRIVIKRVKFIFLPVSMPYPSVLHFRSSRNTGAITDQNLLSWGEGETYSLYFVEYVQIPKHGNW